MFDKSIQNPVLKRQHSRGNEEAISDPPSDTVSPLQAVSLTMLAGFTDMVAGRQALLGEIGREGLFVWDPGDLQASVTADPDQAFYVAPASQSNGSAGAWRRAILDGHAQATWAGVLLNGSSDQAPAINRLLAHAAITDVAVPPGVIWIDQSVVVPADKKLRLSSQTILRALPTFATVDGRNAGVTLAGSRGEVSGGTVDMNKVGLGLGTPARQNGVTVADGVRGAVRRDMTIMNCTGYASYDAGAESMANPPQSYNENLRTLNSQIHLEPMGADGTTYVGCEQGDGDGDVPCLSWLHPMFSRNITYVRCRGRGVTSAQVEITNIIANCENIVFDQCDLEQFNTGASGFIITSATEFRTKGLRISNSRFVSPEGNAAIFRLTDGAAVSDSTFTGAVGVLINGPGNSIVFSGSEAYSILPTDSTQSARAVICGPDNDIRWNGGVLSWNGGPAVSGTWFVGPVTVSTETKLIPAPPPIVSPFVQDKTGVALIIADAGNAYANITVPYTDAAKVGLFIGDLPASADAYGQTVPVATWAPRNPANGLRVRINGGASLGGKYLVYRFVERS